MATSDLKNAPTLQDLKSLQFVPCGVTLRKELNKQKIIVRFKNADLSVGSFLSRKHWVCHLKVTEEITQDYVIETYSCSPSTFEEIMEKYKDCWSMDVIRGGLLSSSDLYQDYYRYTTKDGELKIAFHRFSADDL